MISKYYPSVFMLLALVALVVPVESQSGQQSPANFAQWSENAINWGEAHLNSREWWDSANQQGYCLQFVSNAFMQEKVEGASGYGTALEAANGLYRFDQEPGGWQYAPRGAVIFFDGKGSNKDGHVGIYLGGGRILNAYGKVQEFTIDEAMAKPDVGQYIGWSYPPESWRSASETGQNAAATGA